MTKFPTITSILAVPGSGLTSTQASPYPLPEKYRDDASPRPREIISVGLVLDGKRVAWGDCVATSSPQPDPFRATEGLTTIQNAVIPALQGQHLTGFCHLAAALDSLTETVIITNAKHHAQPQPDHQPGSISRRDLFTGRVGTSDRSRDVPLPTRQVTIERPIHPAIRYGVSQALLAAVALAREMTMAEVIAEEYNLSIPTKPVPIHAEMGSDQPAAANLAMVHRVASLGYTTAGPNFKVQLGDNCENLQRFIRSLQKQIPETNDKTYRPTLHLNVRGGLGQLYDNNTGKILGALFGLERTAAPYPVRVENPVIMDSRQAQIETMLQLQDYLRSRRMTLQLVAGEWVHSLDDVRALIQAGAASMVQLNMPRLGSLHQTIEAVLACRQQGVGILLGGNPDETDRSAQITCHVALATQPDLIMAKPGWEGDLGITLVHNEVARTLAWMAARNSTIDEVEGSS